MYLYNTTKLNFINADKLSLLTNIYLGTTFTNGDSNLDLSNFTNVQTLHLSNINMINFSGVTNIKNLYIYGDFLSKIRNENNNINFTNFNKLQNIYLKYATNLNIVLLKDIKGIYMGDAEKTNLITNSMVYSLSNSINIQLIDYENINAISVTSSTYRKIVTIFNNIKYYLYLVYNNLNETYFFALYTNPNLISDGNYNYYNGWSHLLNNDVNYITIYNSTTKRGYILPIYIQENNICFLVKGFNDDNNNNNCIKYTKTNNTSIINNLCDNSASIFYFEKLY